MIDTQTQFAKDVQEGLTKNPKSLSSKYLYDAKGDALFQAIMAMPEYYLTDSEFEIFSEQRQHIHEALKCDEEIRLIEFGAGDGYKTKILLKYLVEQGMHFTYHPVDISGHILLELEKTLNAEIPNLQVEPLNMDYFEALSHLSEHAEGKNVVLFLGSNIGNFRANEAKGFLAKMRGELRSGDQLLIGVDLKKDPHIIRRAYDDPHGITAEFNLNMLHRMNAELGANFDVTQFKHYQSYNPENGEARSYLVSLKQQEVFVESLEQSFHFDYAEYIHVEISKKYDQEELENLGRDAGFTIQKHFMDCKSYFVDSLWQV